MGLIRLLIYGLLLYIGYKTIKSFFARKPEEKRQSDDRASTDAVQDPVCGLFVSRDDAVVGTLDGKRYYFCSMACLEKFREQIDSK